MKPREIAILVLLTLMIAFSSLLVKPQLNYLIGLNMKVEFVRDGIARVTLKQHPFDASGKSLISNGDVVNEMINEEDSTISLILLFFTSNPSKTSYRVISHSRLEPEEQVLCNTGIPGTMEEFKGAVMLTVEISLNTTTNFTSLGDDVCQVVLTDYFTLTDPRSWIDVIDLRFAGDVKLLNFSMDPSWSKPPSVANTTCLQWLNMNEADAPDNYILTLRIPGVVFSSVARKLKAEIPEVRFSNSSSSLLVNVMNTGEDEGAFLVVFSEASYEQTRKIALKPGENAWVRFPVHVPKGEEVVIKVFGGKERLDEERIILRMEESVSMTVSILSVIGLLLMVLGVLVILLHLYDRLKEHPAAEEAPSLVPLLLNDA
ncbi:MAG: hypothetical protein ACUVUS_08555 [Thermoproteota archaeon]